MSEQKNLELELTAQERKILTVHLCTRTKATTRKEFRWFDSLFNALELNDYEHFLQKTGGIPSMPNEDDSAQKYPVDTDVLQYLLSTLQAEVPAPGMHVRTLLRIEQRLETLGISAKEK